VQEVHSVEPTVKRELRNKEAAWITQSGDFETRATPVWDHGLTGAGQLVGVSDSGFDMTNCLLTNDFNTYPGHGSMKLCQDCTAENLDSRSASGTVTCAFTSEECTAVANDARKVAAYLAYEDGEDKDGHGTHVAGTIVGYSTVVSTGAGENMDDFKGMAPGARIVAVDTYALDPGSPTMMFDFTYGMGAKVHSASWGSNGWEEVNGYGAENQAFDAHTYDNPESLIVIAAGNDGNGYSYGASLDPEAQAKNVRTSPATAHPSVAELLGLTCLSCSGVVCMRERQSNGMDVRVPRQLPSRCTGGCIWEKAESSVPTSPEARGPGVF
jgi:subtilisin family serine protease